MPPAPLADPVTDTRGRAGQTTVRGHVRSGWRCSVAARFRGDRLRRIARMLRRVSRTGGRYYDPIFARPDVVEDDYYRFQHQPCGW
jgi:hypothetical protein